MMAKTTPIEFFKQVRQEANKVTWPSRRETLVTTAMVVLMAAMAAIFFLFVDKILEIGVRFVLGIGG